MIKIVTAVYLALLSAKFFGRSSCPLDPLTPTQNVTKVIGRWREYKKTTSFLASYECTTYNVSCRNGTVCSVNLFSNGTNTGLTNTLIKNGENMMWGRDQIYLNVDEEQQFVIVWNCNVNEIKKYELAVLMRNISNEDTIKEIEVLLENITVEYKYELKLISNTLCNGVKKSISHFTVITIVIIFCRIFTEISNP